jgi:hypothetical protein
MLVRKRLVLVVVAERGVRPDGIVVAAPTLDGDLGFAYRVEDLAIEQFVP